MIFLALILCALVALTALYLDAWHANRLVERARAEWQRDPAPWWVPRD